MLFGCMPFDAAPDAKHAGPVAAEASLYRAIRTEPWRVPEGVATLCANHVPVEDEEGKKVLTLLGRLLEKDVSRRWGTQDVKVGFLFRVLCQIFSSRVPIYYLLAFLCASFLQISLRFLRICTLFIVPCHLSVPAEPFLTSRLAASPSSPFLLYLPILYFFTQ
jgi:hypothetical protein